MESKRTLEEFFGAETTVKIMADIESQCSNVVVNLVCLNVKDVQRLVDNLGEVRTTVHVSGIFEDVTVKYPGKVVYHQYVSELVIDILDKLDGIFVDGKSVWNAIRGLEPSGQMVILKMRKESVYVQGCVNTIARYMELPMLSADSFKKLEKARSCVMILSPSYLTAHTDFPNHKYTCFTEKDPDTVRIFHNLFGKKTGLNIMRDIMDRDEKRIVNIVCINKEGVGAVIKLVYDLPDYRMMVVRNEIVTETHFAKTNCVVRLSDSFGDVCTVKCSPIYNVGYYPHVSDEVSAMISGFDAIFGSGQAVYKSLRRLVHKPAGSLVVLNSGNKLLYDQVRAVVSFDIDVVSCKSIKVYHNSGASCVLILGPNEVVPDYVFHEDHEDVTTYVDKSNYVDPVSKPDQLSNSAYVRNLDKIFMNGEAVYNSLRRLDQNPIGAVVVLKSDNVDLNATVRDIFPTMEILSGNKESQFSLTRPSCVVILGRAEEWTAKVMHDDVTTYVDKSDEFKSAPVSEVMKSDKLALKSDSAVQDMILLFGKDAGSRIVADIMDRDDKRIIEIVCHAKDILEATVRNLICNHPDKPIVLCIHPDKQRVCRDIFFRKDFFAYTKCIVYITDTFEDLGSVTDRGALYFLYVTEHVSGITQTLSSIFQDDTRVYSAIRRLVQQPIGSIVILKSDNPDLFRAVCSMLSLHGIKVYHGNTTFEIGPDGAPPSCVVILDRDEKFTGELIHRDVSTFVDKSAVEPGNPKPDPKPEIVAKPQYTTKVYDGIIKCEVSHPSGEVSNIIATIGEVNKDDLIRAALVRNTEYDTKFDRKVYPDAVDVKVCYFTNDDNQTGYRAIQVGENFYTDREQLIRVFEEIKVCRLILQDINMEKNLPLSLEPRLYVFTHQDFNTLRYFRILHRDGVISGCLKLSDLDGFKAFLAGKEDGEFTSWLTLFKKSGKTVVIFFADTIGRQVPLDYFLNRKF